MGADELLILGVGVGLTALVTLPFWLRARRQEAAAEAWEAEAAKAGLHEPVTLHPVVDPAACIGSGPCVTVCPENVLALRGGQAVAVAPARCVGHGLCERACPVEAIRLVFGTATRGVELPRIQEDFETNVPGLYIIGELGGMGLIANAFEQAEQCVAGIAREVERERRRGNGNGALDLAIVGCGPAGLAASLHARDRRLNFETLEKEPDPGGAVRSYPRRKLVMTRALDVPGYGSLALREIAKEELIELWDEVVRTAGLEIRTGERVTGIHPRDGGFLVETTGAPVEARRVVLAIGRRGTPRKLGVPGEDAPHVAYSLREPEAYRGLDVLVVGGGDSAVEAALALGRQSRVTISYRRAAFKRIKPANLERVGSAIAEGRISVVWSSEVREIRRGAVVLDVGGERRAVPADAVFVFIGGELPTRFLREAGVEIDMKFGVP